jgi:hypothetical protein
MGCARWNDAICRYLCGMRESHEMVGALQYRIAGLREPCPHKLSDVREPRSTVGPPIYRTG